MLFEPIGHFPPEGFGYVSSGRLVAAIASTIGLGPAGQENAPKDPLRIIVFGAHPDDCELEAGGHGRAMGQARATRSSSSA